MIYEMRLEAFHETYEEMKSLYIEHYKEMQARLLEDGIEIAPYKPRLDIYFKASTEDWLKSIILRVDGVAVGYCNFYVTQDMHNGELIATVDEIFVTRSHRNGVGKKLVRFGLDYLNGLGVKRLRVEAVTDLRVEKIWNRMGFKTLASTMMYIF